MQTRQIKSPKFGSQVTLGSPWKHAVGFLLDLLQPKHVDVIDFIDEFLGFAIKQLHKGPYWWQYRVHGDSLKRQIATFSQDKQEQTQVSRWENKKTWNMKQFMAVTLTFPPFFPIF